MIRSGMTRRRAMASATLQSARSRSSGPRAPQSPSRRPIAWSRLRGRKARSSLYTATFVEVEQEVINEFRKKFPFIRIEMIRAPGGQLITRVKTEAASGKLAADVVLHSDRGLIKGIENMFADYAPPNAADYLPESLVSPKLWPNAHRRLVDRLQQRDGEESAEVLDGPHKARIWRRADRAGDRPVGRHHLDPHHVRAAGARRGLLGEAGGDQAETLSVRRAAVPTRWCAASSRSRR